MAEPSREPWGWDEPGGRGLGRVGFALAVGLLALAILRGGQGRSAPAPPDLRVDPGKVPFGVLAALPEVGRGTASAIDRARRQGGLFRSLADFERRVRGIGPGAMEHLRPFLRLEDEPARVGRRSEEGPRPVNLSAS